jgi:glycyl-tRNA synthetase beta chain
VGALLALADRFDSLVGCFAIGQVPTGTADPLALRRATLGILRTVFDKGWDLELSSAIRATLEGFANVKLDGDAQDTEQRLFGFIRDRLRGLLPQPPDVIDACLDAAAGRPLDARRRAESLAQMKEEVRARVGEVFKRAANIAKDAGNQPLRAPSEVCADIHASELALYEGWQSVQVRLAKAHATADYPAALQAIAEFAPALDRFFNDVFVMVDDIDVRNNRLSLMRDIHRGCSAIANFGLLAGK